MIIFLRNSNMFREFAKTILQCADMCVACMHIWLYLQFWMSTIATTLPMPCGIFIPAFAIGKNNCNRHSHKHSWNVLHTALRKVNVAALLRFCKSVSL